MKIRNKDGMSVYAHAMAVTPNNTIAFLSIVGALTAVKAIWASVISRKTPLYVDAYRKQRKYKGDGDVDYVVFKQSLEQGLHHWVLFPDPDTAPFLLLLPSNGASPQELLVQGLNQHTLWPVKEEWADPLWEATHGVSVPKEQRLIRKLAVSGNLEWAYLVSPDGWDDVIDRLAQDGALRFDDSEDEAIDESIEGGTTNG